MIWRDPWLRQRCSRGAAMVSDPLDASDVFETLNDDFEFIPVDSGTKLFELQMKGVIR